jgi:small redox-active disulfide protein 2
MPASPCDAALDITQILLGKNKVGIAGLKGAIEEIRALGARPEVEIAQALLDKLKPKNYIPAPALEEYKQAFLREFKKALGEQGEEEQQAPVIKILGPGCPNCHRLEQLVLEVLSEMHLAADVEHVKDVRQIAAHGVFGMPALIINNEVKAMGKVPSREALKQWLVELHS